MSDDYLWNKSGTPDPEIERLEQLLGDLRYRRPSGNLPLPQSAPVSSRRSFPPVFAIAAAVLFMMVAAGAWFALGLRNQETTPGVAAINVQPGAARDWPNPESMSVMTAPVTSVETNEPELKFSGPKASRLNRQRRSPELRRGAQPDVQLASSSSPNRRERISEDEGVAAREQLIKALHLASSKLNQVQKKIQDNKAAGPVS
ncbi:MAG TPA: hypothetical protein VF658_12165 [Pyrinomonadaceae bacterium]|jgi:hypothetical protein